MGVVMLEQETGQDSSRAVSAVDRVVDGIVIGITEGKFVPGQRLVEPDLAREFAVGRNSVREALRRLSAEGHVTLQQYKGAVISKPTRAEVMELLVVREALETAAARLAAEHAVSPGKAAIVERLREIVAVPDGISVAEHVVNNEQFHGTLFELAGNRTITRFLGQIRFPIMQSAHFRHYRPEQQAASRRDHVDIAAAVLAGDPDGAERAMRTHVRRAASDIGNLPEDLFRPD